MGNTLSAWWYGESHDLTDDVSNPTDLKAENKENDNESEAKVESNMPIVRIRDIYGDENDLPENESITAFGTKIFKYIDTLDPPYMCHGNRITFEHCITVAWLLKSGPYHVDVKKKLRISAGHDFLLMTMSSAVFALNLPEGQPFRVHVNDSNYQQTPHNGILKKDRFHFFILEQDNNFWKLLPLVKMTIRFEKKSSYYREKG